MSYRGRFAPSPTGPLHEGSILTAVASYLDAKANAGQWLVRIEDLDPPRIQPGAESAILRALDAYGLEWDEPVVRQSERLEIYQAYLQQLLDENRAYPCDCTRSALSARGALQNYDGHCRNHPPLTTNGAAVRAIAGQSPAFDDKVQGHQPAQRVGDFTIFRRDGLFAYQLAVVVDDQLQQINHIVRGKDLLAETPKQLLLQQNLNFSQLKNYAHLPLILADDGQKLSKQTLAQPVSLGRDNIRKSLISHLEKLQLKPPKDLINNRIIDIYQWGIEHWEINKVPRDINL